MNKKVYKNPQVLAEKSIDAWVNFLFARYATKSEKNTYCKFIHNLKNNLHKNVNYKTYKTSSFYAFYSKIYSITRYGIDYHKLEILTYDFPENILKIFIKLLKKHLQGHRIIFQTMAYESYSIFLYTINKYMYENYDINFRYGTAYRWLLPY